MTAVGIAVAEVTVSTAVTGVVATAVTAEPLFTALIGFGVSLVTVVGGELIKFLVAFLKKKRENIEGKENKKNELKD